jgi:polyphenol oxidase
MFTGRGGGVSSGPFGTLNLSFAVGDVPDAVRVNRDRVLRAITPGPQRLAWMRQAHGARVVLAAEGPSPEADAIFTDSPAFALGALTADCAPVLLADPVTRLIGAAHAGRPGLAAGVVPALVAAMARAGADPSRMRAAVGPAICGSCYEVPPAMCDQVAAAVPESACTTARGTRGIDLRAGLHAQLATVGITAIVDDARCTAESADLFSYRRDGMTGRSAGVIWRTAR